MRHFPEAEKYARQGLAAKPDDPAMHMLLADVLVRSERRNNAITVLKSGVDTVTHFADKAQILWHLANLYLDGEGGLEGRNVVSAKNIAEARQCMRKMRDYHFSPVQLRFLEARALYANDDWKSARQQFEELRSSLTDSPQLMKCLDYWIGFCYRQQGNPDQAMAAFRRSLSFDKFYFMAHDGIAQIFVDNGQLKDAADEYRQAANGNASDAQAWQAFGRALVRWNLQRSRDEQNWEEVERVLKRADDLNPGSDLIKLLYAEMLIARGHVDQARDMVKTLHESSPQDIDFWVAQANLAARQGDVQRARQVLTDAKAKLGDKMLLRLALAGILLRGTDVRPAADIEGLADNLDAYSTDEKTILCNGLLNFLVEIKEYDRAKRIGQKIASIQPHDATIRYRLLELALLTHNAHDPAASLAEVDRLLEEIDEIAGQGPLWMYGKAVRLKLEASEGKPELLDAAMDYALRAQRMRLSWSRPHVLQGEIYRQRGQNDQALEQYLQASANGDRDLEFTRLLLQMLFERQRYQEADQVIRRLEGQQMSLTPEIGKEEAQIFVLWGGFQQALDAVNRVYDPASDDYRDHVWHGQLLKVLARRAQQEGHHDKLREIAQAAEQSFRRAAVIAPNAPEPRVALVQLLVATKQMDKARIAADDAKEMIPIDVAPLAMGSIYDALGETRKAGESYEKAVKARPNSPVAIRMLADFYLHNQKISRAAPLVERLLNGEVQSSETDILAARRMKAAILVGEGYPKLKEAAALISQNLASPLAQPQDKRLKIRLLLADPRRARDPEALQLAESLVVTGGVEPDPEDRLQVARLYFARGDWDRCQDQMEKLVSGSQSNPRFVADYVGMLLSQGQLTDAQQWLERLESSPGSVSTAALHAELLFRRNNWAEVSDYLAGYLKQDNALPKDPQERLLLAARLVEGFGSRLTSPKQRELAQGYFKLARQWYGAYVEKHPAEQMLLAGFSARRGKFDEALAEIQGYGAKSSPQEVAQVVAEVVARSGATPAQLHKLEAAVVDLLTKKGRPAPLLIGLAEIRLALDRPEDAENLYREILHKDPLDDMACNNLSMVLALQKIKLDEAADMIDKTIERTGPRGAFLDTRAVVAIARHEPKAALQDLELALAEKSTPTRLFHKAWALLEDQSPQQAKENLRLAHTAGLDDWMLTSAERKVFVEIEKLEK